MNNEETNEVKDEEKRRHEAAVVALHSDIKDSPADEEKMKAEEVIIDMPDVSDIPGQEHIHVPQMEGMYDVTIASDDEEGVGIFGDDEEDEDTALVEGNEADVSSTEENGIGKSGEDEGEMDEDNRIARASLDDTDADGDPLNEGSLANDVSGSDLDMSGVDSDDPMESIGEEDEENNHYSLGSDDNDTVTEGTP